jgi:hypothetical protein
MRRAGLGIVGTVVLLELVTPGGLKGGQNQDRAGNPTGAGVIAAAGPEWPSANPRNLDTLPFPGSSSGAGAGAGAGAGIRNPPLKLNRNVNRRSSLLIGLYVTQGALQALDAQATLRALHSGSAREGNPLVRPFASQPAALVVFKLALGAGIIYGIDRLHKSHSRLATTTLGAINAGYVYLVQRSYRSFSSR